MSDNRNVRLAYGEKGIILGMESDWNVKVIEPLFMEGLKDPSAALSKALTDPIGSLPLHQLVTPEDKVGIIFNDITRPTPNKLIIESILKELRHLPSSSIVLFNALGTHRHNTNDEVRTLIGSDLASKYRIVQNDAFDEKSAVHIGNSSFGHGVWINRELMSCNIKILTGFIEPHFFAGFSGGGKAVMPGMAGIKTILGNHDARNIGNNESTWGVTSGNPIWEEVLEVAEMAGSSFLVNVSLNRDKEITNVFAGDIREAHKKGTGYVRQTSMVPVQSLFDIVVTTNSGYPLDLNFYQTVKGISVASRVVKENGTIIAAAECREGMPEHGSFSKILSGSVNPERMLETIFSPGFSMIDQWQAQILAIIQMKSDVYLYSGNLTDEQLKIAKIKRCHDIHDLIEDLRKKLGKNASICIIPEGPQTIPYLTGA